MVLTNAVNLQESFLLALSHYTVYSAKKLKYGPQFAIDGRIIYKSFFQSKRENTPWIRIDFNRESFIVVGVHIYHRKDGWVKLTLTQSVLQIFCTFTITRATLLYSSSRIYYLLIINNINLSASYQTSMII
jgi:hypothetical protein